MNWAVRFAENNIMLEKINKMIVIRTKIFLTGWIACPAQRESSHVDFARLAHESADA
jgi:hypothetical protein